MVDHCVHAQRSVKDIDRHALVSKPTEFCFVCVIFSSLEQLPSDCAVLNEKRNDFNKLVLIEQLFHLSLKLEKKHVMLVLQR